MTAEELNGRNRLIVAKDWNAIFVEAEAVRTIMKLAAEVKEILEVALKFLTSKKLAEEEIATSAENLSAAIFLR